MAASGDLIGTSVAQHYRLVDRIGAGGFATVYLARDLRTNTVVAVKLLHEHLGADEKAVRDFLREADLARALADPHVVRVLDVGIDRGRPYIVMELVEGHTLDHVLATCGRLPVGHAVGLACQALEALEAAHALGIVHRDIKPQNLMLLSTGPGLLKVMDFGIARTLAEGTGAKSSRMVGTVEYMAPEQIAPERFKLHRADYRADLYALGITLFELLTGRLPFEGSTSWETLERQLNAPPPDPRQLRADISEALAAILLRTLAKAPDARFQSAAELRAALLPYAESIALDAYRLTPTRPPAPPVRPQPARSWTPFVAAAVAALAVVAVVAALAAGPGASGAGQLPAPAAQASATGQAGAASQPPAAGQPEAAATGSSQPTPEPTPTQPTAQPPSPTVGPRDALQRARAAFDSRDYDRVLDLAHAVRDQVSASDPLAAEATDLLYRAHIEQGKAALDAGDPDRSERHYLDALAVRPGDAAAREGQKLVALARKWAAMEAVWQDDEQAIDLLQQIMVIDPSYRETRQKLYAKLVGRGERLIATGDRDGATSSLTHALEVNPVGLEARQLLKSLEPTPTPLPRPTETPRPGPTATPTSAPTRAVVLQPAFDDPVRAILGHYTLIDADRFSESYYIMARRLRDRYTVAQYRAWWPNKVSRKVVSAGIASRAGGRVIVEATVDAVDRVNGRIVSKRITERFQMIFEDGGWRIEVVNPD